MLLIAAAMATLAACGPTTTETTAQAPDETGSQPAADALAPIPTDAAAGASGLDNMTWRFNPANDLATGTRLPRLMYVSNGSEGMGVNLQCEAGTVYARLWRGERRDTWPFSLQSGAAHANLDGAVEGDSEVIVTATLPVGSPVLTAFRESGALTLIDGDRTIVMDAINDQERQQITHFFAACS